MHCDVCRLHDLHQGRDDRIGSVLCTCEPDDDPGPGDLDWVTEPAEREPDDDWTSR
ncbi:hypothetical protein [Salinispora pacifica]|uniref:hypothetical protein n=1 Tax=Salinispora pacifica TaxID=351187 RepID=UPI0004B4FCE2|nr:hypothetical protein [Salinispora pacifica]